MTPQDRDFLIRTIIGEAARQPRMGQEAVAHVILNRAKAGNFGGNTIRDVVLAPNQFEPWSTRADELRAIPQNSPIYAQTAALVDSLGDDPTGGATHFLNEDIVRKRRGGGLPRWAENMAGTANRIGDHTFYGGQRVAEARQPMFAAGASERAADVSSMSDDELRRIAGIKPQNPAASLSDEELMKIAGVEKGGSTTGLLGFTNREIAETVGAPVDLINKGLGYVGLDSETPVGGSQSLKNLMGMGGVAVAPDDQRPETLAEHAASGVGAAASMLIPFGAATKAAQGAKGAVTSGVGASLNQPFVTAPTRTIAAELGAGAGAEMGAEVAERASGSDAPLVKMGGAIAGSVAGALSPSAIQAIPRTAGRMIENAPVAGMAIRWGRRALMPFTETGGRQIASDRVRSLAADPDAAAAALDGPNIGNLTPAQQTGDRHLMALERAILDQDAALDDAFRQRSGQSSQLLRDALREPAEGATAANAREAIEARREYVQFLLRTRAEQAMDKAQKQIARLGPRADETTNSLIVRREIDKALNDAKGMETELWARVPKETPVPTDLTRAAFSRLDADTAKALKGNIPEVAKKLLSPENDGGLLDVENVREVYGIYRAMRQTAREATGRTVPNRDLARIANEIAEAALEDLGAKGPARSAAGDAINAARDYTHAMKEVFDQGAVGNLLQRQRSGADAVRPELTLDATLSSPGLKAAVAMDDIRLAVKGHLDARAAMEDYVKGRFKDFASPRGEFNPDRAKDFLRQNRDLLNRMPYVRGEIDSAIAKAEAAGRVGSASAARAKAINDPRRSAGAAFVQSPIGREIDAIFQAKNPIAAANQIVKQAAKDRSGMGVKGVRGAFVDYLTQKSATQNIDEAGKPLLSGRALHASLEDPIKGRVAREILGKDGVRRAKNIARELRKLEAATGPLPNVGPAIDDLPSTAVSFIARTVAARKGAALGQGASGASLLTANFASRRMQDFLQNITVGRANALLRDAINDPELFKALLVGVKAPIKQQNRAAATLSAWLAASPTIGE